MKCVSIWENTYHQQCANDQEMRKFIASLDITYRLEARDSFYGGRTNASQLYRKVTDDEKMKYVDFTSFYPFINKYETYPIGHPNFVTQDFEELGQIFRYRQCQGVSRARFISSGATISFEGKT